MVLEPRRKRFSTILVVTIIGVGLFVATVLGYMAGYSAVQGKVDNLQNQLSALQNQNVTSTGENVTDLSQNISYFLDDNVSLSQLYAQVKESVVVIRGLLVQYDMFHRQYYATVQGSGFVYNFTGQMVLITNYHVVQDAVNVTVTFANGDGYSTTLLGSDPYSDLAVLSSNAPAYEWSPLEIANSSTLEVGDPVIAVGSPYGLAGSMTTGMVSALGRTITESTTSGYPIASVVQTSTPINPGNSGGPLLNYQGQVVGITTAIVSDSQGLGFAIPSNAILREIESLVTTGSYDQHPSLGATGTDMTYEIAQAMGTNVTYGWLVVTAPSGTGLQGGTRQAVVSGSVVTIGGDIVVAINGTRIMNIDDLSTYLEENTVAGETVNLTIIRSNATLSLSVKLVKRG
jgi:S1-C subfamily serine protease